MATAQPITAESITKHVQSLLAMGVTVKMLPLQEIGSGRICARIDDETGALACVVVCDVAAAGSTGAALSRIPAGAVQELLRRGNPLDDDLLANFHEVANVLTVLTTAALGRRTILRGVEQTTGPLARDLQQLVKRAQQSYFMRIAVLGYPPGSMNIFVAA